MTIPRRNVDCLSDLAFDEWLSDAIEPGRVRDFELHVERCVRCALRHEVLSGQRAAFLERVPSWNSLASSVSKRNPAAAVVGGAALRHWIFGASVALAASALLALGLPRSDPPSLRSKGGPHLGAYVKRGDRVARIESGALVRPGDYVRFTYSSAAPMYFALLNRDARAAATYYPLAAHAVRMQAGSDVALDFSIKLDRAPGSEQVYGLFCDEPQPLEPLRSRLASTGKLPPLPHCRIDVLTLNKQEVLE